MLSLGDRFLFVIAYSFNLMIEFSGKTIFLELLSGEIGFFVLELGSLDAYDNG